MNKVDSEPERMAAHNVAEVVTYLVFILIAQVGEKRDGSGELVVAEGFKSRDGQGGHAERKLQGEAEIRVARLGQMQQAGIEHQSAEPGRTKCISVAKRRIPVIIVRDQSGRG